MCFLTLNCINIALHQINKILFFLATSYDPFKSDMEIVNISWASLMTALSPARKQWLRTHTYTCSHIHTHLEYFDWMSRTLCCCMYLCVNMQACMCVTFNVLLKVGYVIFQKHFRKPSRGRVAKQTCSQSAVRGVSTHDVE